MPDELTSAPGGTTSLGGRTVARMGYGAMQLARLQGRPDDAQRLLRRAVELGIDHIDTAPFYGAGTVDQMLRGALRAEDGVLVVSKVGAASAPSGPHPIRSAQRPEELRAGVEASLHGLGVDQIAIVNLRRMEGPQRIPVAPEQMVDLDDQLAEMIAMRDEGLIGAIGLSTVGPESVRRALPVGIACVQNSYSLVAREGEDMLRLCAEHGIPWVPYFPLGGAFPGAPRADERPEVLELADRLAASPSQISLAWLLNHAPHVLLIPGTASIEHLEHNVAAGSLTLDADAMAQLDAIGTTDPTDA